VSKKEKYGTRSADIQGTEQECLNTPFWLDRCPTTQPQRPRPICIST
jgi:hypothetical protein